ncbi:box C/D snoRNA protein 1 [Paralichthys olivaceus]|uniref:box C/D snoRNA protein 1 n=1 Tax=Paralichthys olivaceus TaxID=8255 RepID=UPI00097D2E4D|nr:PREDICTED: box C/D snoRNA protein 1 [Paralichthys olivaceus]
MFPSPTWFCGSSGMCSLPSPTTGAVSPAEPRAEHSGEEEEQRGTKRKMSLSDCVVCRSEEAKYRCPACLTHSCSLLCVKKHKEKSGCSGVRDKAAFVSLSQFDEMALLSDYRFLEDTGRFADGTTRDRLIRAPRTTFKAKRLAACGRKMNITLRFLPITFTKSRENSTVFLSKEKLFMWHLKLIFPQGSTEFSQRRVSDSQTLKQILTPYIHPTESDPVTRQKLKVYVHAPSSDVKVFMKAEGRKANSVRYHELDIQKSLRDNLSYKTLIEYPVLHVVLREHWKEYPLKGPAEPASARSSFETKREEVDHKKEDVTTVSPSPLGSRTTQGTHGCVGARETSPETEPPQEKRAKRESREQEVEEGEITDASEDEEEVEDHAEENNLRDNSVGDAKSSTGDMQVITDELVDKYSDSSRDQCLNEAITGSTDDISTATDRKR